MLLPPVRFSGDPDLDWIITVIVIWIGIYSLRAAFLAREGIGFFKKQLSHAALLFIAIVLIFAALGQSIMEPAQRVPFAGLVAGIFVIVQLAKKRSRYIPKSIRNAVIARDLKGAKFDSRKHHIDHRWPFSLGGSSSQDNLRVIDKNENLKKGAKRPRFRDMW